MPVFFGMINHTLIMVVDTAMVGRLGPDAIAATGMGGVAYFTAMAFLGGAAMGVQIITARRFGEHDHASVRSVLQSSMGLALTAGTVISLAGYYFGDAFISLLTDRPQLRSTAGAYLSYRYAGTVGFFLFFALRGFLDGIGRTMAGMYASFAVTFGHLGLNWLLIYGNLGFPKLGVNGAGISSAVSSIPGLIVFLIYIYFERRDLMPYFSQFRLRLKGDVVKEIIKVSFAPAMEGVITNIAFLLFIALAGVISINSVAASNVIISTLSLSFMPGFAFGIAATTVLGQAMGAKKYALGYYGTFRAALFSAMLMGCMGVFFIVSGKSMIRLFTDDLAVIREAYPGMIVISLIQVGDAYHMVVGSALRGAGLVYWVLIAYALTSFGLMLPAAYILGITLKLGTVGLWSAVSLWLVTLSLVFVWKFRKGDWKTGRV